MIDTSRFAAWPIHAYQWTLRPLLGGECRFVPRCSDYALEALATHGTARGIALATRRVCRCHPWCAGGHDPVPPRAAIPFAGS